MTRNELLERLDQIHSKLDPGTLSFRQMNQLVDDIKADGVLDVQCPPEIAESMNLPRPADPNHREPDQLPITERPWRSMED